MPFMMKTIEAFKREGKDYPIIVGGVPVTRDYANNIGAAGYADNADEAVTLCKELVAAAKVSETQAV
jgi:5-methyltetrahydrofolate--homocysteine methyltransferase